MHYCKALKLSNVNTKYWHGGHDQKPAAVEINIRIYTWFYHNHQANYLNITEVHCIHKGKKLDTLSCSYELLSRNYEKVKVVS